LKFLILFFLFVIVFLNPLFASVIIDTSYSVIDSTHSKKEDLENNNLIIHEIRIIGNQKTKKETILREINLDLSKPISPDRLKFFENRILSLGLFNDVKIFVSKEADKNVLIILVQEAWYIWPLPFVDIADRDWKKITYGLNLGIQNLTGKNESLNTGFSLGYDPKFYLSYYNPNFSFEHNLILKLRTVLQKRNNRSIEAIKINNKNFSEKYYAFEIGIGKRLNIFNFITSSIAFEYLQTEEYYPLRTVSNTGIDRAISFQFNYIYDTRDFTAYPKSGANLNIAYKKVGLGETVVDFNILEVEAKKIFSLGNPVFYLRNYSRVLVGPQLPYYANSFIGYRERLRGYFNDIFESNSLNFSNLEFRFPLIEKYVFKFNLPYIPEELITYNLNVDFHTFFDIAFLVNKNQVLKKTRALNGFGFGFSFLFLPYRSFNIEVAWNQLLKPQFIFDLNLPF